MCVLERERERERELLWVCMRGRERECITVGLYERERERVLLWVCMRGREREYYCGCV